MSSYPHSESVQAWFALHGHLTGGWSLLPYQQTPDWLAVHYTSALLWPFFICWLYDTRLMVYSLRSIIRIPLLPISHSLLQFSILPRVVGVAGIWGGNVCGWKCFVNIILAFFLETRNYFKVISNSLCRFITATSNDPLCAALKLSNCFWLCSSWVLVLSWAAGASYRLCIAPLCGYFPGWRKLNRILTFQTWCCGSYL